MLLDCPACATPYHVDRADLDGGRLVICSRCDARWCAGPNGSRDSHSASSPAPRGEGIAPGREAPTLVRSTLIARCRPAIGAVASLALVMVLIGAREKVVRWMPRMAALYQAVGLPVNIRGLAFAHVMPERIGQASQVTISGEIRNIVSHREPVPRLAYEVRDAAGQALVSWIEKGPAKVIAAGKTLAFVSTPHMLPDQAKSVLVRFDADDALVPASALNR